MRMFFATDIHGSEVCWKKFLNSGKHYKADVVVLGGDMTGKALVPIVDDGDGKLARDAARQPRGCSTARTQVAAVRAGRPAARLLPVPHRPRRAARARPTTSRAGTRCSRSRCSRPSSAGWQMADERLGGTGIRVLRLPRQRRPARGRRGGRQREDRRARRGPRGRHRRLPDGLERLGQPHAVGHLPRGGRGRPARADRAHGRGRHRRRRSARSSTSTARPTTRGSTRRRS